MGCFLVSTVAAIGVGVARHAVKHHEKGITLEKTDTLVNQSKWSDKLKYLELTLWGGSFLLAGEHVLHGEVTPYAPFLTAAKDAEDTKVMLQEMGTVGVTMLAVLVLAWGIGVLAHDFFKLRKKQAKTVEVK